MKYRKKPVVVEAIRLGWDTWNEVCEFAPVGQGDCRGVFVSPDGSGWSDRPPSPHRGSGARCGLIIPTLEGNMLAIEGDWIIKGVKGEFYPCKPDIFEATYELVEEEKEKPHPGSSEALALGCICPIMDNSYGLGRMKDGENLGWIRTVGCPVHQAKEVQP